jgi:hypothetical protein
VISRGPGGPARRVNAVAVGCAAALVALGVAGFTANANDPLRSPDEEALREVWGRPRGIRSDEYAVELPLQRAQQTRAPPFARVDLGLGLGQLQRDVFEVPVLDWGIAFRPLAWPLLLGTRWAHGVRWFLRSALLWLGLYFWCRAVVDRPEASGEERRRRAWMALAGAMTLFWTSSLTWWLSSILSPLVAFTGLCVGAASRHLAARTSLARAWWLAVTGWLAAAAFFWFYPPFWAPALWLLSATIFDVCWRERPRSAAVLRRLVPPLAAVAVAVVLSIAYFAPYLALVTDTVYPGRRVALAGALPRGLLVSNLWPSLQVRTPFDGWESYRGKLDWMNVCEASAVEALPLLLFAALACTSRPFREAALRVMRQSPGLLAALAVLLAWLLLPLPAPTGLLTLLRWSPWPRVLFGAGLGAARARDVAIAAAVLLASWMLARDQLASFDPRLRNLSLLWAVAALAGVAVVPRRVGPVLIMGGWAASLLLSDVGVNPLLRSRDLFRRGAGHAVVDEALRRVPGRLVDYTGTAGSVLAAFGWPILGGVAMAPDLDLSRFLAPESPGLDPFVYNRYAHVHFVLPPAPTRLVQGDLYELSLTPCSERLAALGVNHVLVPATAVLPPACAGEFEARPAGRAVLWTRRHPVAAAGVARVPTPSSWREFDYGAGVSGLPALRAESGALVVDIPAGGRGVSVPINRSVVEAVECDGARPAFLDAHFVAIPDGQRAASCRLSFLTTGGGLRRLLHREARVTPPLVGER